MLIGVALATFAMGLGPASEVLAHPVAGGPATAAFLDGIVPPIDGVTVEMLNSAGPMVILTNLSDDPVELIDGAGEVWLRVGPDVTTANVTSERWAATTAPFGFRTVEVGRPLWQEITLGPAFSWYSTEARTQLTEAEASTLDGVPFSIPIRHAGVDAAITGRLLPVEAVGNYKVDLDDTDQFGAKGQISDDLLLSVVAGRGLHLRSTGDHDLLVRGEFGEPFVRITPEGASVNVRSPAWLAHVRLDPSSPWPIKVVDPDAEPEWREIFSNTYWTWWDPRLLPRPRQDSEGGPEGSRGWEVPIEVDGETHLATGTTTWVPIAPRDLPPDGPNRTLLIVGFGLGAVALGRIAVARTVASRRRS